MTPKKAFAVATVGALVGSFYTPADAQQMCGKSEEVESFLKREFNESILVEASHESGATLQFFVSPDMKTGTFIMKRPDGISCFATEVTNIRPAAKSTGPTKEI